MSFTEEKRKAIKTYMLDKIREDDAAFVAKTGENFGISITTVKRYLSGCSLYGDLHSGQWCRYLPEYMQLHGRKISNPME